MNQTNESHAPDARVLFSRVRDITKNLHDALRELGHDKRIEASLGAVPDAKARLSFIARVTGEAAEKVLNTVDAAQAQQEGLVERAGAVAALLRDAAPDADLRGELLRFAEEVQSGAQATSAKLTDIMLAQDFHDLTGQTVGKVVEVATAVEDALLQLLLETSSAPVPAATRGPLDGPVADSATRTDVVANQAQVDDLLASLGF